MFQLEGAPPQFKDLVSRLNIGGFLSQTGNAASNVIFILIFLGFLFSSAAIMSKKLDAMFPQPDQRDHIRAMCRFDPHIDGALSLGPDRR